jgi:hypothetical protein
MRFLVGLIILVFALVAFAGDKFISAQSMAASFRSTPLKVKGFSDANVHCVISDPSSTAGELKLAASNLPTPTAATAADWVDISSTAQEATADPSTHMWNLSGRAYEYVQVVYTRTAGSGTLNCYAGREY